MSVSNRIAKPLLLLSGILIWGVSGAASEVKTSIHFSDRCTREPIAATSSGEVFIDVQIDRAHPGSILDVQVEVAPVGPKERTEDYATRVNYRNLAVAQNGRMAFRLKAGPDQTLKLNPNDLEVRRGNTGRLWQATVSWNASTGSSQRGVAVNKIYLMANKDERFYELVKPDALPICMWRRPLELVSPYYFNRDAYDLHVSQTVPLGLIQSERGINVGVDLATGRLSGPLFPVSTQGGWAFAGFRDVLSKGPQGGYQASISKSLPTGQGGYFTRKIVYARFEAKEHRLREGSAGSCSKWTTPRTGYVDIPREVYEFALVPQEIGADAVTAQKTLDLALPPVEACNETTGGLPSASSAVANESDGTDLYFLAKEPIAPVSQREGRSQEYTQERPSQEQQSQSQRARD